MFRTISIALVALSLVACGEVPPIDTIDAGTTTQAPTVTSALVRFSSTWAQVTTRYSDGSEMDQPFINDYDPQVNTCEAGFNLTEVVDLTCNTVMVCTPIEVTCPDMSIPGTCNVDPDFPTIITIPCKR
jgi:hypothetical protein